jgi:predicted AAA+ superfamily ATPase
MTWQEMDYSSGAVSVGDLLKGERVEFSDTDISLETIIKRIIKGGWPGLLDASMKEAILINRAYVDLLTETDMSRASNIKRDPLKIKALLKSLARNTATLVETSTLESDIRAKDNTDVSRPTIADYIDVLQRLMIIEDQPAFNPHIRSSASLRKSAKRHFCDVSLAVAALELNRKSLMDDLKYTGFLFESMVTHDLRVYAQANDAEVSHYRDSSGLEIDAIVKQYGGNYAAFEIKLGVGFIEEAAKNLLKFYNNIDTAKMDLPKSLNVITGTDMSYSRPDGINVISLSALGR